MNFPSGGSPITAFGINRMGGDGFAFVLGIEKHPSFELDALPKQALFQTLARPIDGWILCGQ